MGRVLNFFAIGRPKMNFLKLQREPRCTLPGSAEATAGQGIAVAANGVGKWICELDGEKCPYCVDFY